jgi:hypothetical protein
MILGRRKIKPTKAKNDEVGFPNHVDCCIRMVDKF